MTHRVWWRGLPLWLKLVFLFVAIPAWLFIVFCIATGRDKSAEAP